MKPTINLKFQKFDINKKYYTLRDIVHMSKDGICNEMMENQQGFRFSQVVDSMLYYHEVAFENKQETDIDMWLGHCDVESGPYIIPVAVQYSPVDWTDMNNHGIPIPGKRSVFEFINPTYLKDLREGNAILLLDQSVEGYGAPWLWQWFHDKCKKYDINPAAIIYLTGDQACTDTYGDWCSLHKPANELKVLPSISLTMYLHKHYVRRKMDINFDAILEHKRQNKDNMYLFDCTNMRPRPHRILNFLHMINAGLLEKGNISMSSQKEWRMYADLNHTKFLTDYGLPPDIVSKLLPEMTPATAKYNYEHELSHYYHYVERILDDMYRNSWVSLITESSYFQFEFNAFLSEKTFKPIASMQPFIILGSKGSVDYLRRIGFKSFDPWIDESYSTQDDSTRFLSVMNAIKQVEAIPDKVEWYASMRDVLEHNHAMFVEIGSKKSTEHTLISDYYFEYFKDKNV